MNILVIGGGGREYAIIWKIIRDEGNKHKIYAAPGNGGICDIADCVEIKADEIDKLLEFAKEKEIDFTIVGPEVPLSMGIVDLFRNNDLKIFGPDKISTQIESSKIFAKDFMNKYGIPTADYIKFNGFETANKYISHLNPPFVLKADGLSAGKGSFVIKYTEDAIKIAKDMLLKKSLGEAGAKIVIESFLRGEEASLLVLLDGNRYRLFLPSQDHKQVFDGDKGLNTGGMGAYAPYKGIDDELLAKIRTDIIEKTIEGFKKEGIDYRGILYVGLMLTEKGPYVVEYNARFGDPETQALMPILKSNLLDLLMSAADGDLGERKIEFYNKYACCVVFASEGYPKAYEKGIEIKGLPFRDSDDKLVFHAGTKRIDGKFVTNGGRVLNAIGLGEKLDEAIENAYKITEDVFFENMHYRTDIGEKGLKYEK
ncbi:phosphoribosylamine--glycine ligase [candidate division TA06 bacterium]|uniref:Phosphoribosylamine--glycine ligase n=1 Tax=candidate division TA06 bacterium TaxID=2250710 RepID=A0A660S812_UNCT6|nr:MAG: phosphoribosylamine--glycine ligase [candidate division TA06 bacterium]